MSNTGRFRAPVGSAFGYWTVVATGGTAKGRGATCWLCRCRCGVERIVMANHARSGKSRGCGDCFEWRGQYVSGEATRALAASLGVSARAVRRKLEATP
jgi:hypothetical protein